MTTLPFKTNLRDGTPILVRQVEHRDKRLLQIGLEHLSQRSRYLRFFRPVSRLSDREPESFSTIDQVNHIALGALDLAHDEPYPIGVARGIRLDNQPHRAEIAVAVIDTHQGKGLGTVLLAAVARAASEQNIEMFTAAILADNHAMLELFGELAAERTSHETGTIHMDVPIHRDADKYPQTPAGEAFRRVYQIIGQQPSAQ